jgi:predicted MFS family arabinose efflux permease
VTRLYFAQNRWIVLAIIWTVFVVHGVDRSVVLVLLEPMRKEFGLSDTQVGLISGLAYAVPFALAGIPLGALADRYRRPHLLAILLAFWILFTGLAGLATTFPLLLLARAGVGASEAGAPRTMLSLLGDTFDARSRPAALSVYFTAPFIGVMLGSIAAGRLTEAFGWRHALLAVGLPGILLSVVVALFLREPRQSAPAAREGVTIAAALRFITRDAELRRLVAATVLTAFVSLSISNWVPAFLQRIHGIALGKTGIVTALSIGLTGGFGSLIGGFLGARLGKGDGKRLQRICGSAVLASLPLAVAAPLVNSAALAIALIAAWSILGSVYLGPGWGDCPCRIATAPAIDDHGCRGGIDKPDRRRSWSADGGNPQRPACPHRGRESPATLNVGDGNCGGRQRLALFEEIANRIETVAAQRGCVGALKWAFFFCGRMFSGKRAQSSEFPPRQPSIFDCPPAKIDLRCLCRPDLGTE